MYIEKKLYIKKITWNKYICKKIRQQEMQWKAIFVMINWGYWRYEIIRTSPAPIGRRETETKKQHSPRILHIVRVRPDALLGMFTEPETQTHITTAWLVH